ncbi:MAG: hypothetical protein ACHP7N_11935 [Caulobacterales bacterium]
MGKILLTVLVVILDLLSLATVLLTFATRRFDTAGAITGGVFCGVLILNMTAIQFGARFKARERASDPASVFD